MTVTEAGLVRRHTSAYAVGRIAGVVAQAATVVILSRMASGIYLDYSLILAAVLATTGLTFGWERQAMLRRSMRHDEHESDAPVRALAWSFTVSGVLSAGLCVVLVSKPTVELSIATFLMATTYGLSQFSASRMQATLRPYRSVALESLRLLTTPLVVLAIMFSSDSPSLATVVWVTAISNIWPTIVLLKWRGMVPRPDLKADLAFGLPIAVWLLLSTTLQYSDRWVLGHRVSGDVAAQYAATTDLVMRGTTSLMAPLVLALHPLIMSAASNSGRDWKAIIAKGMRVQVTLATIAICGGLIFIRWGDAVVPNALTEAPVVFALILSSVAWQVVLLWHKPFEIAGRTGVMALAMFLALGANVSLNWFLANSLGPTFVAASNGLSIFVYAGVLNIMTSGKRQGLVA